MRDETDSPIHGLECSFALPAGFVSGLQLPEGEPVVGVPGCMTDGKFRAPQRIGTITRCHRDPGLPLLLLGAGRTDGDPHGSKRDRDRSQRGNARRPGPGLGP